MFHCSDDWERFGQRIVIFDLVVITVGVHQRKTEEQRDEDDRTQEKNRVQRLIPEQVHEEQNDQAGLDRRNGQRDPELCLAYVQRRLPHSKYCQRQECKENGK